MVVIFFIDKDPKVTAKALDNRRLGKQRVEAKQIIRDLLGETSYRINHPSVKSWRGHVEALKEYYNIIVNEWVERGYNNTMELYNVEDNIKYPSWANNEKIHFSHQARLIQKDEEYYKDKFNPPSIYLQYDYIWPCNYTEKELNELSVEKLASAAKKEKYCESFKKDGKKCKNKANYGLYCGVHKPKNYEIPICIGTYKNGNLCRNKCKQGDYCIRHQVTITEVKIAKIKISKIKINEKLGDPLLVSTK